MLLFLIDMSNHLLMLFVSHLRSPGTKKKTISDLPLLLILSVYTDSAPLEIGKIQIFFLEIWQNREFFKSVKEFSIYLLSSYRFVP